MDAMAASIEHIALLKRSDADLFRFHAGPDWASESQQLGRKQCFDVNAVLVAPRALPGRLERISERLTSRSVGNGWYRCQPSEAAAALTDVALSTSTQATLDAWGAGAMDSARVPGGACGATVGVSADDAGNADDAGCTDQRREVPVGRDLFFRKLKNNHKCRNQNTAMNRPYTRHSKVTISAFQRPSGRL